MSYLPANEQSAEAQCPLDQHNVARLGDQYNPAGAVTAMGNTEESSNMITNYKNNLNMQLDNLSSGVSKNSANSYIQKTCDIAERVLNEIERERVSLLELEANVERLSRQLSWQYEAYQRKTQQFECFKQNIETLFNAFKNINILEEIKTDTHNKIQQLQQTSESIATQQWRDFINESTENLLRDISSLSNL